MRVWSINHCILCSHWHRNLCLMHTVFSKTVCSACGRYKANHIFWGSTKGGMLLNLQVFCSWQRPCGRFQAAWFCDWFFRCNCFTWNIFFKNTFLKTNKAAEISPDIPKYHTDKFSSYFHDLSSELSVNVNWAETLLIICTKLIKWQILVILTGSS
jgi:hypothetical protein